MSIFCVFIPKICRNLVIKPQNVLFCSLLTTNMPSERKKEVITFAVVSVSFADQEFCWPKLEKKKRLSFDNWSSQLSFIQNLIELPEPACSLVIALWIKICNFFWGQQDVRYVLTVSVWLFVLMFVLRLLLPRILNILKNEKKSN